MSRSKWLGVKTNEKKYSEFDSTQKFIGFVWNGVEKTVGLPPGKKDERMRQISPFLDRNAKFNVHDVMVLAGRLNHLTFVLPQLRCYLRSIYRWQMSWQNPAATRETPDDMKEDLTSWLEALDKYKAMDLIPDADPTDVGWVGDASTSFGIGVIIGKKWAQFRINREQELSERSRSIAWLETAAIRIGLISLISIGVVPGRTFIVWTDNTTTHSAILQRKSRDTLVNKEWKKIQELLLSHKIDISPRRVVSKENRADGLSRGDASSHNPNNKIEVALPEDLQQLFIQI